ncbi:NAD(+) diphosphatase [Methanolobus halotolerans]|uniref:NAD(+) diphosphatase n=1 Tax=Methanolobus halotolerans TaxID=2052935 RepID=A0A4E0QYP2_9EURY|nr:NAD(+) diphosphatase [Methanolobus halotolerans]TGC08759.1 NAD(+) diphosphatase [Methanolobus halotolerans]
MIREYKLSELDFFPLLNPPEKQETCSNHYFVFKDRKILLISGEGDLRLPSACNITSFKIDIQRKQYLGEFGGFSCFAAETIDDLTENKSVVFEDIRKLPGIIGETVAAIAGRAVHLLEWDKNTLYCGHCGSGTLWKSDERAKECTECGLLFFPKISPAIIVMIEKDNKILMARSPHFPPNRYGLIAGFVEPGESIEEAVVREVIEEVGIRIRGISYFGSQPWPYPDSLMIAFTAKYLEGEIRFNDGEIEEADWFSYDEIPHLPGNTSISGKLVEHFISGQRIRSI